MKQQSPTTRWVEIKLDNIAHNFNAVKQLVGTTKILAVVKADAYGHGAVRVAQKVLSLGADYLGVSYLQEALQLRSAGIGAPILIMSLLLDEQLEAAVDVNCTITVNSIKQAHLLNSIGEKKNKTINVHLNIDVGMHRYGVDSKYALEVAQAVNEHTFIKLEGLYTHFPKAENSTITLKQLAVFKDIFNSLEDRGIDVPIKHCANSTATVTLKQTWLDMIRIGTLIFGQCRVPTSLDLKPTWGLMARINSIRQVPKGHSIGYGQAFRVKRDSRIGIIPLGFADGVSMWPVHRRTTIKDLLKSVAKEILRFFGANVVTEKVYLEDGVTAPYIGKIGMQHFAIDLTDQPQLNVGTVVGVRILQASVNATLPKVYLDEGVEKEVPVP